MKSGSRTIHVAALTVALAFTACADTRPGDLPWPETRSATSASGYDARVTVTSVDGEERLWLEGAVGRLDRHQTRGVPCVWWSERIREPVGARWVVHCAVPGGWEAGAVVWCGPTHLRDLSSLTLRTEDEQFVVQLDCERTGAP